MSPRDLNQRLQTIPAIRLCYLRFGNFQDPESQDSISVYAAVTKLHSRQDPAHKDGEAVRRMARVYADVNQHMPKSYWEYDTVNITWGVLENYEVVRKIGKSCATCPILAIINTYLAQDVGNIRRSLRASIQSTIRNASSKF